MGDGFPLSVETVLLFLAILFIAFCCGFLRSLKRVFDSRRERPSPPPRNILVGVAHIRIPSPVELQNDVELSSVYAAPAEEQLSPPPYSAVSNILPPSYDEAIKQNGNTAQSENGNTTQSENEAPKLDSRF